MTINWQDVIVTVFSTIGGGAVLLGAAAYLIKAALTQRLLLDAEMFKGQLKASADAEIERLKVSLQMSALEHEVRFSKLHEKRAEVIAELYGRLVEISMLVHQCAYEQRGGERGVMRDLLIETQTGEPAPRQVHAQFLHQLPYSTERGSFLYMSLVHLDAQVSNRSCGFPVRISQLASDEQLFPNLVR